MFVTATLSNNGNENRVVVETAGNKKSIAIPAKRDGQGSAINGAELLCLALATCFCNDIYREAARRNLVIRHVEVSASGSFAREGEAGTGLSYQVSIDSDHSREQIDELISYVDKIAEIHQTVRGGTNISLRNSLH